MGEETASKLKERMAQWQEYVETGFADGADCEVFEQPEPVVQAAVMEKAAERKSECDPVVEVQPSEKWTEETRRAVYSGNGNNAVITPTIRYVEPNGSAATAVMNGGPAIGVDNGSHAAIRPGSMHSFRVRNVPASARKRRPLGRVEIRPERRADLYLGIWVFVTLVVIVGCVILGMHASR
jgi:hypothetical protein